MSVLFIYVNNLNIFKNNKNLLCYRFIIQCRWFWFFISRFLARVLRWMKLTLLIIWCVFFYISILFLFFFEWMNHQTDFHSLSYTYYYWGEQCSLSLVFMDDWRSHSSSNVSEFSDEWKNQRHPPLPRMVSDFSADLGAFLTLTPREQLTYIKDRNASFTAEEKPNQSRWSILLYKKTRNQSTSSSNED